MGSCLRRNDFGFRTVPSLNAKCSRETRPSSARSFKDWLKTVFATLSGISSYNAAPFIADSRGWPCSSDGVLAARSGPAFGVTSFIYFPLVASRWTRRCVSTFIESCVFHVHILRRYRVGDSKRAENIGKPPIKKSIVENSRKTEIVDDAGRPSFLASRSSKRIGPDCKSGEISSLEYLLHP